MLFGCSSAKHTDRGGRANFVGASYGYLKAGWYFNLKHNIFI